MQNSDDVIEILGERSTTVGEFLERVQLAGLVPQYGITNVTVSCRSRDLSTNERLLSAFEKDVLVVQWEECKTRAVASG